MTVIFIINNIVDYSYLSRSVAIDRNLHDSIVQTARHDGDST